MKLFKYLWAIATTSFFTSLSIAQPVPIFGLTAEQSLSIIELSAGPHRIEAEVADSEQKRRFGLMYRRSLPSNRGMLFVFSNTESFCMWMENTYMPLSVAFLDDKGQIINIEDMRPQTKETHCAAAPARYALEVNQGWFAARGIVSGMVVHGLDAVQEHEPK